MQADFNNYTAAELDKINRKIVALAETYGIKEEYDKTVKISE